MRALVDQDIIIRYSERPNAVEVGDPPTEMIDGQPVRVGLERLRFDGTRIIDLNDLTEIWVDRQFGLHATEAPGSQLVAMRYTDRANLINDAGTLRIKSEGEIEQEQWSRVRAKRDKLLAKTDWTQLPDSPTIEGMVEYRQALRDIPQNFNKPEEVVYPEEVQLV